MDETTFASKHNRSVDAKRTTIWSMFSPVSVALSPHVDSQTCWDNHGNGGLYPCNVNVAVACSHSACVLVVGGGGAGGLGENNSVIHNLKVKSSSN